MFGRLGALYYLLLIITSLPLMIHNQVAWSKTKFCIQPSDFSCLNRKVSVAETIMELSRFKVEKSAEALPKTRCFLC